jgi:hypothetical protein
MKSRILYLFHLQLSCLVFVKRLFFRDINPHAKLLKKDGRPQIVEKHVLNFFQPLGELVISKFELQITSIYFRKSGKFLIFRQASMRMAFEIEMKLRRNLDNWKQDENFY